MLKKVVTPPKKAVTPPKKVIARPKKVVTRPKRIKLTLEQQIEKAIYSQVENDPLSTIIGAGQHFIVLSKFITLSVNKVVSNSHFQPYETNFTKNFCVVTIVEWGPIGKPIQVILDLKASGCPVYKINFVESVYDVLRKT